MDFVASIETSSDLCKKDFWSLKNKEEIIKIYIECPQSRSLMQQHFAQDNALLTEFYKIETPEGKTWLINRFSYNFPLLVEFYKNARGSKEKNDIIIALYGEFIYKKKEDFFWAYKEIAKIENDEDLLFNLSLRLNFLMEKHKKFYLECTNVFAILLNKPLSDISKRWVMYFMAMKGNKHAVPLLEAIAEDVKNSPEVRASAIRYIGDIGDKSAISFVKNFINHENEKIRIEAYFALFSLAGLSDDFFELVLKNLKTEKSRKVKIVVMTILSQQVSPTVSTQTKEKIAKTVAEIINSCSLESECYSSNYSDSTMCDFGESINAFHHSDPSDFIRKSIIKNLNTKSRYYLMSICGEKLYPSTFLFLYQELTKKENFLEELKEIDPEEKYAVDFTINLGKFGKLSSIIKKDEEFFYRQIEKALRQESSIMKNTVFLIEAINLILRDKSLKINKKFQSLLFELYQNYSEKKSPDGIGAIGYIIKVNKNYFDDQQMANKIYNELPELLPPVVPNEWLKDKKLVAKLYFYPDENWFLESINFYLKKLGIEKVERIGDKIILTAKAQNQLRIPKSKVGKQKIEIEKISDKIIATLSLRNFEPFELQTLEIIGESGKGIATTGAIEFYKDNKDVTVVIKRKIKDIETVLIFTKDNSDVIDALQNEDIDIMVHRGHIYHLSETFPREKRIDCKKKLLFFGACSSFKYVPEYQQIYNNCYYIADQDTGRGNDNNRILEKLIEEVINKETYWENIKTKIQKSFNPEGIVYPHEIILTEYIKKIKRGIT
jgi:hypothetical protein